MKLKTGTYKLVIKDDGNECTYDVHDRLIHSKYPNGFEAWTEYDEEGNVIHYKDSTGFEAWYEYDDNGYRIHRWDSAGHEEWYDYYGREVPKKYFDLLSNSPRTIEITVIEKLLKNVVEVDGKKYKLTPIN